MRIIKHFIKGENEGHIVENNYGGEITYTAVAAVDSKDYKTLKGAENFLKRLGYQELP